MKQLHFNAVPLLLALFVGIFPQLIKQSFAADVLLYEFDDDTGAFTLQPQEIATGILSTTWSASVSTLRDVTGNPGRAVASSSFNNSNRFELLVELEPDATLNLESIAFEQTASASGPNDYGLLIDDVELASGTTTSSFQLVEHSFGPLVLSDSFTIAISGSNAGSNLGTFRLDNFALQGNIQVVPLPPAVWCLLSALLGLARRRRQ